MRLDLFRGLIAREQRQSAREHECHARKAVVRRRGRALKIHACLAQAAQHVLRLRACKPRHDALCRDGPDVADLRERGLVRLHERVHGAERARKHLGGLFADLPDAERIDQAAEIGAAAGRDGVQQLLRGARAALPEALQVIQLQVVDIRRRMDVAARDELVHNGLAEALDIHGAARNKVRDVAAELGRALRARAAKPRASKIAANDAAAIPLPNDETTPPVTKI